MTWARAGWAQVRRQPLLIGAGVLVVASSLLSAASGRMAYQAQRDLIAENLDRREQSCVASNETRDVIRALSRDAPLEVGESIIEVSAGGDDPPDPAVLAQFREVMNRRLTAIVNQLPARRWDSVAEECVDVSLEEP